MSALRAHVRLSSWIAALAILLVSLAPALGQAWAAKGSSWMEVCTAQGAKWVQAGEQGSTPELPPGHLFDHCPYCSLHAPALGLPPPAGLVHQLLRLGTEVPTAFLAAPRSLHAWVSAQPRAPPRFS